MIDENVGINPPILSVTSPRIYNKDAEISKPSPEKVNKNKSHKKVSKNRVDKSKKNRTAKG